MFMPSKVFYVTSFVLCLYANIVWGDSLSWIGYPQQYSDPIIRETLQGTYVQDLGSFLLPLEVGEKRPIIKVTLEGSALSVPISLSLKNSPTPIMTLMPQTGGVTFPSSVRASEGNAFVLKAHFTAQSEPGSLAIQKLQTSTERMGTLTLPEIAQNETLTHPIIVVTRVAHTPRAEGFTTAPHDQFPKIHNLGKPNERLYYNGTFRIPAITKSGNVLIGAFDVRYRGNNTGGGDLGSFDKGSDLGFVRSFDGGRTWSTPYIGIDVPNAFDGQGHKMKVDATVDIADPCLLTNGNEIYCMGYTGDGLSGVNDCVYYTSTNEGLTWENRTSVKSMCGDGKGRVLQGPGSGIVMRDGTMVCPMQTFMGTRRPFILTSIDKGKTWTDSALAGTRESSESAIVELENGDLLLMAKCEYGYHGNGAHTFCRTANLGKTWTQLAEIKDNTANLPKGAPTCQGSMIRVRFATESKPGLIVCAWPIRYTNKPGLNYRGRIQIRIGIDRSKERLATEEPIEWLDKRIHIRETAYGHGYTSMVMIDDITIGLFYEDEDGMMFTRLILP